MRTQRVVSLVAGALGIPLLPVRFLSGFVLGCLISLSFGLLLLVLSLVYVVVFFSALLALSWLWLRVPLLRLPVALLGVPWAVLAYSFVTLVPEGPEDQEAAVSKRLFTILWPYSWPYFRWDMGRLPRGVPERRELLLVLERETRGVPPWRQYVEARLQREHAQTEATSS